MKIAYTYSLRSRSNPLQEGHDRPETMALICECLSLAGHEIEPIDVSGPLVRTIARLESFNPDLVLNTARGHSGVPREAFYSLLCEELGIPFIGSQGAVISLVSSRDLARQIAAQSEVATPRSWRLNDGDQIPSDIRFPAICRQLSEMNSEGEILQDARELTQKLSELIKSSKTLLIEEKLVEEGFTAAFLEENTGDGGIRFCVGIADGEKLDASMREELTASTLKIVRAFGLRGLGTVDFKLNLDDKLCFVHADGNPSFDANAVFWKALKQLGYSDPSVVFGKMVDCAAIRHGIAQTPKRLLNAKKKICVGFTYNLRRIHSSVENDVDTEAEFDSPETIGAVREAIVSLGYDVVDLEANAELPALLPKSKIDVVFNIAEGMGGRSRESLVPALLDLMQIPYTGSDVTSLSICHDKILAKRVVSEAGIQTSPYFTLLSGREKIPKSMQFPLIIKPAYEGSSKGIHDSSVVMNEGQLRSQAAQYLARYHQPLLAEAYLPGREFTVGLLGEKRPQVLPIMEVVFTDKSNAFPVYSFESKVNDVKVRFEVPAKIESQLNKKLSNMAKQVFAALGCRDYARMDFRLDDKGNPFFLECNPLPGLTPNFSDLVVLAAAAGFDYRMLIAEMMAPALRRMRVQQSLNAN